jgi:hypothetical protein
MLVRTLSNGHVSDDPLDGILPLVAILTIEVGPKLKVLAYSTMMNSLIDIEDAIRPDLSLGLPWRKRSWRWREGKRKSRARLFQLNRGCKTQ